MVVVVAVFIIMRSTGVRGAPGMMMMRMSMRHAAMIMLVTVHDLIVIGVVIAGQPSIMLDKLSMAIMLIKIMARAP